MNRRNYAMDKGTLTSLGKYISYLLRHHPEDAGISLDRHGWADADALIDGVREHKYKAFTRETLDEVVRTDSKGRFTYSDDGTKIKAHHGHSVNVELELSESTPPDTLYHGTAKRFVSSIEKGGLLPQSRLYVHLSSDIETAISVGKRHGEPVIFQIDCASMVRNGFRFYRTDNGIWLTKTVPPKYLERL